jgi:hypothetical protein
VHRLGRGTAWTGTWGQHEVKVGLMGVAGACDRWRVMLVGLRVWLSQLGGWLIHVMDPPYIRVLPGP